MNRRTKDMWIKVFYRFVYSMVIIVLTYTLALKYAAKLCDEIGLVRMDAKLYQCKKAANV